MLSMITLAYEVWQQKKQEKNRVEDLGPDGNPKAVVHGNGNGRSSKTGSGGSTGKLITVGTKQVKKYMNFGRGRNFPLHE